MDFISEDHFARLGGGKVRSQDILLCIRGSLGRVAMASEGDVPAAIASSLMILRPRSVIEPAFLFFFLASPGGQAALWALDNGAAQPNVGARDVARLKLPLPPAPTQQKIAAVLSAYDDLIERNLRRIAVLEEVAERIYREWFTELRYPDHNGAELVPSELGSIPSDWEVISLGSKYSIVLGGTPSRKRPEYWTDGTVPWINSGRVNDLRIIEPTEMITETALQSSNARLMPRRSTVVAITGATLGQVSFLEIDSSANQSVVGITDASGADCEWLFLTIKTEIDRLLGAASGGAQQHINKADVSEFRVILPDSRARARFASVTRPIFDGVANLLRANRELRATRDLLLPRLMDGEIEVDGLDIAVEAVGA